MGLEPTGIRHGALAASPGTAYLMGLLFHLILKGQCMVTLTMSETGGNREKSREGEKSKETTWSQW